MTLCREDWSRRERWVIAESASSDMENRCLVRGCTRAALGETENGFLVEASREAEICQAVETSRARPEARRRASGLGRGLWLTNGLPSGFVFYGVEMVLSIYARGTPFYGTRQ